MSSHRYQRVNSHNHEDEEAVLNPEPSGSYPSSPPPSFHSRSPSPSSRLIFSQDPLHSEADRTLEDAFGNDDDDSDGDDEIDDRQRLMRGNPTVEDTSRGGQSSQAQTVVQSGGNGAQGGPQTAAAATAAAPASSRIIHDSHDGVFANLAAKPERGEKLEDLPPSYEQAAADATPPYWETTIVAPGMSSNEVFVDGLPVGSFFSFVWNGMISTSFQLVGFLLTYLLHTTHAAKNGSRAGLGLTLVQYGFYMKGGDESVGSESDSGGYTTPPDPNSHDFDPDDVSSGSYGGDSQSGGFFSSITTSEWISYVLMIVGWFILIRSISDYLRARRHEQLVLQSPERGLPVPIIAEGEQPERVV